MLRALELLKARDVWVTAYQCDGTDHGWSDEEPVDSLAVVLVRSGVFRRRVDGVELLADPMVGYVQRQGSVEQIAHPCGGDLCTVIGLSRRLNESMNGPRRLRPGSPVFVSPALDLAHRSLLSSIRQSPDQFELAEQATALAGELVESGQETPENTRPRTAALYQRLTDRVREALDEDAHLGLEELAAMNDVSTYQLSRIFRAVTGTTLSKYRIRLRARLAVDRIANGERNLALVAADVGFADQAHMTRTLRQEIEMTPGRLRNALTAWVEVKHA